jgi:hypothetical protein
MKKKMEYNSNVADNKPAILVERSKDDDITVTLSSNKIVDLIVTLTRYEATILHNQLDAAINFYGKTV